MKKSLFFFAAAALAFASCSNDETVEVNQSLNEANVISFRPFINAQTRAADLTTDGLHTGGFYVTAIHKTDGASPTSTTYFDNVNFTWDGTSSYTSTTKYYWPASGTLDFFAYAPTVESNSQITRTDYKTFTVTPSSTVAEQVDLIYANTDGKSKTGNAGVPLNFRHTGSKIVVKVKNSDANNLKYEITGMKIVNVDGTAKFTYNDGTNGENNTDTKNTTFTGQWSNNTEATEKNISYSVETSTANSFNGQLTTARNLSAAGTDTDNSNWNMILIPQKTTAAKQYASASENSTVEANKSYIALKMVIKNGYTNIEVANAAADGNWAIWPVAFSWEPGKKYTYTIDLAGGGYWEKNADTDLDLDPILENAVIKFVDVTVDNWSDDTEISVSNP